MGDGVWGRREYQRHRGSTVLFFPVDPSRDRYVLSHQGSRRKGENLVSVCYSRYTRAKKCEVGGLGKGTDC